jgi:sugar/nucleoside kinase (ribokinase family)
MYLVCGEALFDVFIQGDGARGNELVFKAIAGGSPFNVALGLRRMGANSALFTGISSDHLGQRLRQVLHDEGVSDAYLIASEAPTTLAMVGVDAAGSPQYSFRGEGCADRLLQAKHLPTLDAQVRGVHVGSFSLVVEPVASTLLALVQREHQRRLISLDPQRTPRPGAGCRAVARTGRSLRRLCASDQGQRRGSAAAVPRARAAAGRGKLAQPTLPTGVSHPRQQGRQRPQPPRALVGTSGGGVHP